LGVKFEILYLIGYFLLPAMYIGELQL